MKKTKIALSVLLLHLSTGALAMNIQSNAAAPNSPLPVVYTCDGSNKSPQLSWSGAPAGTQSYALIVSDPDAPSGTFYHWVLFNIPANVNELPEGVNDLKGAIAGTNSYGKTGYNGPCPPKGSSHRYIFTVYALDKKLNLTNDTDAKALTDAMKSHVLQKAEYTMVYSRMGA